MSDIAKTRKADKKRKAIGTGSKQARNEGPNGLAKSHSKEGFVTQKAKSYTNRKGRDEQATLITKIKLQPDESKRELDEAEVLLREIKSLGGDQQDFEFLKDVDSDEDAIVTEALEDKRLANDLESYMATLGDLGEAYAKQNDKNEEVEDETFENDGESPEHSPSDSEEGSRGNPLLTKAIDVQKQRTNTANTNGTSHPIARSGMLVDPNPLWYDQGFLPNLPETSDSSIPDAATIARLHARGSQLLSDMSETFSSSMKSNSRDDSLAMSSTLSISDRTFISTILQSGTSSDKLSALILLSSSSPLHTTPYLVQLLALTKKKSRDEAVRAIRAIVDWLKGGSGGIGTAGFPDRKLRWFADQPFLNGVAGVQRHHRENGKRDGDEYLLVWAFEDWLKKWYFDLLKVIEDLSHDPLPFVRNQMVGFMASLLTSKPEQEHNLLRLLADKIGDSDRTVSSRTSYHLLQILQAHPLMKSIIVREMASIVLRPATISGASVSNGKHNRNASKAPISASASLRSGDHSRYYGIITLNQIMLSRTKQDKMIANSLIEVYFDIFKDLLDTHANEAEDTTPIAVDPKDRKRRRDEMTGKRNTGDRNLKAMPRKERRRIEKTQHTLEAESKIMAAVLTGVNRAFPFSEVDGNILHNRMDTLFRIIHTGTFNVSIQALMLIFQVTSRQQAISERFYRVLYDSMVDPRLASCSKQAMYLNLLFKAVKADASAKRIAAFVKRLAQSLSTHQPPFICGALYLLGELFNLTPGLRSMLTEPEDQDDIEAFRDVLEDSENEEEIAKSSANNQKQNEAARYDGRKRDPQYANASNSCLWELIPLLKHFHPSVALHASQLLVAAPISTTPDLELHTVSHFLDRFVYRNPKKTHDRKDSLMKPGAKGQDRSGMVLMRKGVSSIVESRVNTDDFIAKEAKEIPVDQLFFHKFFNQKQDNSEAQEAKKEKRKRRTAGEDDDEISVDGLEESDDSESELQEDGSDLDESEVWKAMQASMPDAEEDNASLSEDSGASELAYSDSNLGIDDQVEVEVEGSVDKDISIEEEEEADPQTSFAHEEAGEEEEEDDDDELAGFEEEPDDILGSDEEIAVELPNLSGQKEKDGQYQKSKRRKLKHLPAFASASDWAAIINAGDTN